MISKKGKVRFGISMAILLWLQLSAHSFHIFSSHHSIDEIHMDGCSIDSQIQESFLTCDLCAKLLAKTLYLEKFNGTCKLNPIPDQEPSIKIEVPLTLLPQVNSLRGPPTILS